MTVPPPIVAPSILAADFARLAEEVRAVEDAADWLHVDVMDNHFVPNLTIGLPVVQSLRAVTAMPFDVHLMIEDPRRWAPGYADAGAYNVTFHAEASDDPVALAKDLRSAGAKAGLAIDRDTPIEPYLDLLPSFDTLLIMTIKAGFGGQRFIPQLLDKVRTARRHISAGHLELRIEVDGGIAADTIEQAAAAGADAFVAGTAVYGAADPAEAVRHLRALAARAASRRLRWSSDDDRKDIILVVDDDEDIARFVEFNLRLHGFEVIHASDGQEALEVIERQRPDLAVVDLMMPRIDGLELTRRLRADPMTSAIPVIMLTAKGMTVDKVHGLSAGADDYLVKPFDTAELVARVSSTLRRNKEFREVSPLTGLPGNSRIRREISDRVRHGVDYAVGYIDIDRFKSVNDRVRFRPRRRLHLRAGPQPAPGGGGGRAAAGLPRSRRWRRLRHRLRPGPGPPADVPGGCRLREVRRHALRPDRP